MYSAYVLTYGFRLSGALSLCKASLRWASDLRRRAVKPGFLVRLLIRWTVSVVTVSGWLRTRSRGHFRWQCIHTINSQL